MILHTPLGGLRIINGSTSKVRRTEHQTTNAITKNNRTCRVIDYSESIPTANYRSGSGVGYCATTIGLNNHVNWAQRSIIAWRNKLGPRRAGVGPRPRVDGLGVHILARTPGAVEI